MPTEDKVRENRLRRMALRQGLHLRRSRRRDRLAIDYGVYWLIDPQTNTPAADAFESLDEVEQALIEGRVRPARREPARWIGAADDA